MDISALRKQVETILPEAQVTDFREANPALVHGLERRQPMLTLVSLVTMVLSAIGVAMAMHAHLQQRLETIAIMKALGARSSQVMRIYLLQTLFLGVVGALLGVGAGFGVARAFPVLLERLVSLPVEGQLAFSPVADWVVHGNFDDVVVYAAAAAGDSKFSSITDFATQCGAGTGNTSGKYFSARSSANWLRL